MEIKKLCRVYNTYNIWLYISKKKCGYDTSVRVLLVYSAGMRVEFFFLNCDETIRFDVL